MTNGERLNGYVQYEKNISEVGTTSVGHIVYLACTSGPSYMLTKSSNPHYRLSVLRTAFHKLALILELVTLSAQQTSIH